MAQALLFSAITICLLACFSGGISGSVKQCEVWQSEVYTDGCNDCWCEGGKWYCTKAWCPKKPTNCIDGQVRAYGDGCNTCSCYRGQWLCTKRKCPTKERKRPHGPEKPYGEVRYWTFKSNKARPGGDGSNRCHCHRRRPSQELECRDGQTKTARDGCNTCICSRG